MTQTQIEKLTPEEYSHFLSYGELEHDNNSQLDYLVLQLFSDETCDCIDERKLSQGLENVRCIERYDRI